MPIAGSDADERPRREADIEMRPLAPLSEGGRVTAALVSLAKTNDPRTDPGG